MNRTIVLFDPSEKKNSAAVLKKKSTIKILIYLYECNGLQEMPKGMVILVKWYSSNKYWTEY